MKISINRFTLHTLLAVLFISVFYPVSIVAQTEVNGRVTSSRLVEEKDEDYPESNVLTFYYDFFVNGCKGHQMMVETYFTDEKGNLIKNENGGSPTKPGDFTCEEDTDTQNGWSTSGIGIIGLKLTPGKHKIKAYVKVFDKTANKYIEDFVCEPAEITITKPNMKVPYVKVIDYKLFHNEYNNNNKGMKICYDFYARGLKEHELVVEWYITKANGAAVYGNNGKPVVIKTNLNPTYDSAYWFDKEKYKLWTFFNYGFIKLPRGKHNLLLKMRVYDKTTRRYINFKSPTIDITFTR